MELIKHSQISFYNDINRWNTFFPSINQNFYILTYRSFLLLLLLFAYYSVFNIIYISKFVRIGDMALLRFDHDSVRNTNID